MQFFKHQVINWLSYFFLTSSIIILLSQLLLFK